MTVYTPIACVRRISVWTKGYSLAIFMIIFATTVLMAYSVDGLVTTGPANDGFKIVNVDKLWDMIGFSFYTFEGIGTVLPILKESQNPKHFPRLLTLAFVSISVYFIIFAVICYAYFGYQNEPIIINNIKDPSTFIRVTKLMYCVNLIFSYPLSIYPTNVTIESYTLKHLPEGNWKYWLSNLSRLIVCFLACFSSIIFERILDEFLGLTGALLGIPIILIVPTWCHLRLCAETRAQKNTDRAIITFSLIVFVYCSIQDFKTLLEGI